MKTMSQLLPRLRLDLDFMPSPMPDRPGLLIRDPYHYSDATLIIPPVLVECLQFFDGTQNELDVRSHLVRSTGDLRVGQLLDHLKETLSNAGFLDDEVYQQLKEDCHKRFAEAPVREAAHSGSAYPEEADPCRVTLSRYLIGAKASIHDGLIGIAAPHVSPEEGLAIVRRRLWNTRRAVSGARFCHSWDLSLRSP